MTVQAQFLSFSLISNRRDEKREKKGTSSSSPVLKKGGCAKKGQKGVAGSLGGEGRGGKKHYPLILPYRWRRARKKEKSA